MRRSALSADRRRLLAWYAEHKRDLPWRRTSDPYRILVSEVMLQQTQVSRVVPSYERFIRKFPDVGSLATAELRDVLAEWKGLGYPVRARRLRETARRVASDGWPTTADELTELPGIGPYTAAAVASFAFQQQVAAVDTNVKRVVSRWVGSALAGRELQDVANDVIAGDAGEWNQAMMELGATLCRPTDPDCSACPVSDDCADPSVYRPPPRQSRYEGSQRQERGRILSALVESGPLSVDRLRDDSPFPSDEFALVVEGLQADGLISATDEFVALND